MKNNIIIQFTIPKTPLIYSAKLTLYYNLQKVQVIIESRDVRDENSKSMNVSISSFDRNELDHIILAINNVIGLVGRFIDLKEVEERDIIGKKGKIFTTPLKNL